MADERRRLEEDRTREHNWKRWGPYLSDRQWGTVREDYSDDGDCWRYLSHDHARSRAFRWGEDGLLGVTDRQCRICVSPSLWNTQDHILKERLFGLTGQQGNHGEDVKELYYFLDSSPTHSYMKGLYKYPQSEYPYSELERVNAERSREEPEYELMDTGIFKDKRYWDITLEYCKSSPNDILIRYTVANRGPEAATIHVLPNVWFRNTWSWGKHSECACVTKPNLSLESEGKVICVHEELGEFHFDVDVGQDGKHPPLIFTENDTNFEKLYGSENTSPYVKDAFHNYVVDGKIDAVNPDSTGTKCAAHYVLQLAAGEEIQLRMRLYHRDNRQPKSFGPDFDQIFVDRKTECDDFYNEVIVVTDKEERNVVRQAYAGLLWSKQFYYYVVKEWLNGDANQPPPPDGHRQGRNREWKHLFNRDIISMPDKWEYPWYASWDLAFHMITFADIDIEFAKSQLLLFLREWYMHPNGQIPAYEFAFDDVNPPVHAYAVVKVYKASGPKGKRDDAFLERCFHKLVLNFTWWVNRKDPDGKNIFSGGFLGLDNIGVFDRSKPLAPGTQLAQADATAWMAFYCITMLEISLILSYKDAIYEDMASKFFEHFLSIVDSINNVGGDGLWNHEDSFFYDHVRSGSESLAIRVRSMVGLVPLFSCIVLSEHKVSKYPGFYKRCQWYYENRPDLAEIMSFMCKGREERMMMAMVTQTKLKGILKWMLDENEFLSPYGIRSLSKCHMEKPFILDYQNQKHCVNYQPGESTSHMFGGNSNWRGPIWLCMNYLLLENLDRYDYYFEDQLLFECPTGSGKRLRLKDIGKEIRGRMAKLFLPDADGHRPCHGGEEAYANDPHFKDLILFYEYFHGCSGRGCGASHQTGWTALIASMLNVRPKMKPRK